MKQHFLMWGLASMVFLVTLAISARQEGLWPKADETPPRGNRPAVLASADPIPVPVQPFGPVKPAPPVATPVAAAAMLPPPQAVQQPEAHPTAADTPAPMPAAEAEVDTAEFLRHRDRASQHSARSR
jgi:hypothetical protein